MHLNGGRFSVVLLQQWYLLLLAPHKAGVAQGLLVYFSFSFFIFPSALLGPQGLFESSCARAFGSNTPTDVVAHIGIEFGILLTLGSSFP